MNAAGIQAKINRGEGIAAATLGTPYDQYRPAGTGAPLVSGNHLGVLNCWAQQDFDFRSRRPNLYGHPVWALLCDRTLLAVGDYIQGAEGIFFVIAMQALTATAAVSCNQIVTVSRPTEGAPGANYYGGVQTTTPIITAWPASVLQGTKGERGDVNLPGDVRAPWVAILLPAGTPQIRSGDIVTDAQAIPMRYVVSGAEQTDLGYRITAAQAMA